MQLKPIMMKRFYTLISIVLLFAAASAQTVTLTFTGRDANNQTVALDSVVINNLTKGWQETLTTPDDTVLTLQNGTGIGDVETMCTSSLRLSQNNPNPFDGTTKVNLTVTEPGIVTLDIADVNGRIVRTNRVRPEIGTHQFRVTLSTSGTYVMTARQNGKSSSVKMVCNGTGNGNRIEYAGAVWANNNSSQSKSRTRSETDNPFDLGDEMEYVGFATINGETMESQHVTQAQNGSETIVLTFTVAQTDGLPCPGTPTVTDIDGNVYNTVMIGTQCWMKENLRTIANIPSGDTHTLDDNHTSAVDYAGPWRYTPNNDPANVAAYGYLYNWNAVMNGAEPSTANPSGVQGICPYGWHVPSGNEWIQLADYVGNQNEYSCNGIVPSIFIAKALADSVGWDSSTNFCAVGNDLSSNNATGFSARPAGVFGNDAVNSAVTFNNFGQIFGLWTSSEFNSVFANWVIIKNTNSTVTDWNWGTLTKKIGMSVRCVRD